MTTLYKYRSLENLGRILDILLHERLYAANFKNLNDPMEGHYRYSTDVNKELRTQILDERNRTLICSLSKKKDIGLMWTHYANENKGCCIELQVTSPSWTMIEVDYKDKLPNITNVKEILSVKLDEEVVDPDDIEMLEDLVMAATNEALRMAEDANAEVMNKMTGGLGGGLPF